MNEFDEWIGFIIRWAATGTLASGVVGLLALLAWLPLEYAWEKLPLAARLAWVKVAHRLSVKDATIEMERRVLLEWHKLDEEKRKNEKARLEMERRYEEGERDYA